MTDLPVPTQMGHTFYPVFHPTAAQGKAVITAQLELPTRAIPPPDRHEAHRTVSGVDDGATDSELR
ncbi:hypothetical protein [Actinokineospora pegani]|uniref:hypothetical protein n=1 Tax=Actinokineospora pegani TaxID=2654637 RepID=UPI0012EA29C6|nr:hypothetical protein [Actinokineospora pegani]